MPSLGGMLMGLLRAPRADDPSLQQLARSRKEAGERGFQLLIRNLSPLQLKQYQTLGYFDVIGGDTGRRYRIRRGYQMNIEQLDRNGRRAYVLCFLPEDCVPVGDVMLAQKLALELFETEAIEVAVRSPRWDGDLANELRLLRRRAHR